MYRCLVPWLYGYTLAAGGTGGGSPEAREDGMADAGHGQQRRVRMVGNSWVVPVPLRVRKHFRWKRGGTAYWHISGPREAVLTPHATRVGGKPYGDALEKDLRDARAENERLRRKLGERPQRVFNQGASAGVAIVERIGHVFDDRLRAVWDELAAIRAELGMRPARRVRRGRRPGPPRSRPVEIAPGPDEYPSPSPSPSVEVSGGAAASGGDTPQAAHE